MRDAIQDLELDAPKREVNACFPGGPAGWLSEPQGHLGMTSPSDGFQDGYALEFRDTTYRLPSGVSLISGLNLKVAGGETLILLGRSGSGKTTTLKLINRLLEPTEGQILIAGRPSESCDPIKLRRGIGYIIQDAGLFPHWTVERNVGLVPTREGGPAEKIKGRARAMLSC